MSTIERVAHRFVWASGAGLVVDPCDLDDCSVARDGRTSCGSIACPSCGRGGSNLSITQVLPRPTDGCIHCGCGHRWPA